MCGKMNSGANQLSPGFIKPSSPSATPGSTSPLVLPPSEVRECARNTLCHSGGAQRSPRLVSRPEPCPPLGLKRRRELGAVSAAPQRHSHETLRRPEFGFSGWETSARADLGAISTLPNSHPPLHLDSLRRKIMQSNNMKMRSPKRIGSEG